MVSANGSSVCVCARTGDPWGRSAVFKYSTQFFIYKIQFNAKLCALFVTILYISNYTTFYYARGGVRILNTYSLSLTLSLSPSLSLS